MTPGIMSPKNKKTFRNTFGTINAHLKTGSIGDMP